MPPVQIARQHKPQRIVTGIYGRNRERACERANVAIRTVDFVEKVSARPGQGVTSMFRFGVAFGSITGLLVATGTPLTVQPKDWQRHAGVGPASDEARQRAAQLYPAIAPLLSLKCHANRPDALLLAHYGPYRVRSDLPAVAA
jgi:crossover junction endodeoxyribonuclease RuvC